MTREVNRGLPSGPCSRAPPSATPSEEFDQAPQKSSVKISCLSFLNPLKHEGLHAALVLAVKLWICLILLAQTFL